MQGNITPITERIFKKYNLIVIPLNLVKPGCAFRFRKRWCFMSNSMFIEKSESDLENEIYDVETFKHQKVIAEV